MHMCSELLGTNRHLHTQERAEAFQTPLLQELALQVSRAMVQWVCAFGPLPEERVAPRVNWPLLYPAPDGLCSVQPPCSRRLRPMQQTGSQTSTSQQDP